VKPSNDPGCGCGRYRSTFAEEEKGLGSQIHVPEKRIRLEP
jgi:hypothetical protein